MKNFSRSFASIFLSDFFDFIIWFWVGFNSKRVPPCVTISRLDSVTQICHGMGQLGHQTIVLGHIWNQPWNWHTQMSFREIRKIETRISFKKSMKRKSPLDSKKKYSRTQYPVSTKIVSPAVSIYLRIRFWSSFWAGWLCPIFRRFSVRKERERAVLSFRELWQRKSRDRKVLENFQ